MKDLLLFFTVVFLSFFFLSSCEKEEDIKRIEEIKKENTLIIRVFERAFSVNYNIVGEDKLEAEVSYNADNDLVEDISKIYYPVVIQTNHPNDSIIKSDLQSGVSYLGKIPNGKDLHNIKRIMKFNNYYYPKFWTGYNYYLRTDISYFVKGESDKRWEHFESIVNFPKFDDGFDFTVTETTDGYLFTPRLSEGMTCRDANNYGLSLKIYDENWEVLFHGSNKFEPLVLKTNGGSFLSVKAFIIKAEITVEKGNLLQNEILTKEISF